MCSLYNHACDHWNWWNYCEVWNSILNLFSLFPSVCSVPSVLFCFILSTIAAPHSHKGTPRLELNNCSFIVSIFSLRKIKRYGKDLQLSFRLAIIGRIFGMPAPIMLHHTLTQSLSQYWVNESHYSWEALYSFLWTSFQHSRVCSQNWALSWRKTTFYSEEPLNVVIRNHCNINCNFKWSDSWSHSDKSCIIQVKLMGFLSLSQSITKKKWIRWTSKFN